MIFTCAETLSAASRYFPLEPGDLIFTGTPDGVILGKPKGERNWLKPGDTVEVTIGGIGTLVTPLRGA
jgi:2-keto-4-pentenoate hydratase/2-oxohepta-3-ene-1,7-dioic acid hydratase in catechol pathway